MSSVEIKLRTLTPLWTGGIDGTMDRIHETGILGSLRWWYEAIVRGLGGSACDPTNKAVRCPDKDGKYCDVCAVFGATGLQRAFRMEGPIWWNEQRDKSLAITVNNNRGWYLKRGFMGERKAAFRLLRLPENWQKEDLWQTLLLTVKIISEWGGLGPRTQQGYGVVEMKMKMEAEDHTLDAAKALESFKKLEDRHNRRRVRLGSLPSLDKFFFAKVRLKLPKNNPKSWLLNKIRIRNEDKIELDWHLSKKDPKTRVLPLAPVVRYYLREFFRESIQHNGHPNAPARWRLMGVINGMWHTTDLGKIEKWYCPQCDREWDHSPSRSEHGNCNGKPRKKAKCINCGKRWKSFRDAQSDESTRKMERRKSLIHVSHAYPVKNGWWEFRIWGWVPDNLEGISREDVLDRLKSWLGVSGEGEWEEVEVGEGTLWEKFSLAGIEVWWQEVKDVREFVRGSVNNIKTEQ